MGDQTAIEWTDATWNPTAGCDRVSPGCDHCYALTMAKRLKAMGQPDYQRDGDPRTSGPGFGLTVRPHMLDQPLRWRRPRRIFVNSMSDLFHEEVPDEFIARVFAVMTVSGHHTFQILTKRHARLRALLSGDGWPDLVDLAIRDLMMSGTVSQTVAGAAPSLHDGPLPNVWLGVSVEDQRCASIRIPALVRTPAAVRFLSVEPMIGAVDLEGWLFSFCRNPEMRCPRAETGAVCPDCLPTQRALHWVIVGGESGPGSRPMHPDWARRLRDQCRLADVSFLFKQWGSWVPCDRTSATHLLNVNGSLVTVDNATSEQSYGSGPPTRQDLIDRGHPGWVRVRQVSKHAAGRTLDGQRWDQYPELAGVSS